MQTLEYPEAVLNMTQLDDQPNNSPDGKHHERHKWNRDLHGWLMTVAWCVFAFVQLATNRYLRGRLWKSAILIHSLSGFVMYGLTLWSAYIALNGFQWNWSNIFSAVPIHFSLAVPIITLTFFIVMGGMI